MLTKNGSLPVGILLFERLFTDVPEVRHLFSKVGIDGDETTPDKVFTADSLRNNKTFTQHAQGVVDTLDFVVKNLDDTDVIVKACVELGEVHKMHSIKPEYFDRLGTVFLQVLQQALNMELNHPTIQAWRKAYGAVSATAKQQL